VIGLFSESPLTGQMPTDADDDLREFGPGGEAAHKGII
jgi:hypothetical protein